MNTPYTYLIGWSSINKWYYGVRYAKVCHPSDLWVKYFTSSKEVASMRKIYGEPDVIQVRKIFNTPLAARNWEDRVIHRIRAVRSNAWLNLQNSGAEFNSTGPETRRKISEAHKGRPKPPTSDATREKIRQWHLGRPRSEAVKEKLRAANIGKTMSVDVRAKISAKTAGVFNANFGGLHQTEEVKMKMRKPKSDSSKMGRWERTPEWKALIALQRAGKKAHYNTEFPGVKKMFKPGEAPAGWN